MDMWMDVDTALAEVPVNIMPLIDDTDFKTIEDAVAYNATGMALFWHFVTTAGAYTVTAVTPTTAGTYDWTDQGTAGVYTIEIPASGGASINNDTEGFGWFTGKATGVLPWRGPTIGFRAAALNDALIDGGDLLDVNLAQILGTALTETAGLIAAGFKQFFNIASPTSTMNTITTVTTATNLTTNNDKTGYGLSSAAVQAIWDTLSAALTTANSIGKRIVDFLTGDVYARVGAPVGASISADVAAVKAQTAAIETDTAEIGTAGAGLTNINLPNQTMDIVGNITGNLSGSVGSVTGLTASNLDATISSRATPAQVATELATYDGPTNAEMVARTLATASYATASALATTDGKVDTVDTVVGAIKAKTDSLTFTIAGQVDSNVLTGGGSGLDAAATRAALGMASADLDTQLAAKATASALSTAQTAITAIKAKTDSLTYTVANQLDANVQSVNDVTVAGTGAPGDEWGPT